MSAVHEKTYVCSESLYKAVTLGLEMCAWRRSARDCLAELGTVVAAAFGGHRWGSWWETGETRTTTTISRRDTVEHQDMKVDKVDRDCLVVFGPRVAAFSGHL